MRKQRVGEDEGLDLAMANIKRVLIAGLFAMGVALVGCGPRIDLADFEQPVSDAPVFMTQQAQKIKIVGSSTVAPFSMTVAEQFGAASSYASPIVESTGTGGGFKAFCRSLGGDEPSIVNASRRIKSSERELCAAAGITEIIEVNIGFDGIVIANAKSAPEFDLTKEQIYRALAAELPNGAGGWQVNSNRFWSDISPELPALPIIVLGPPPTSGTRDAFADIALVGGALAIPEMAELYDRNLDLFGKKARTIRNDGAWIDSGENDSSIVRMLLKNENSVGVVGFSFLEQNLDRVKGARVNGVEPVFSQIENANYGISRSLFMYVKKQNTDFVPGLADFVREFTQEDSWGPNGYLVDKGLIPLTAEQRRIEQDTAWSMTPIS